MRGAGAGPYVFTLSDGLQPAAYSSARLRLVDVVDAMDKAGELENGPFTLGDLRRTVETRLAGVGISDGVRAQLQSHDLGGIQARHHDRHDYGDEKRAALEALYRLLTSKAATVTPIKKARYSSLNKIVS